VGFIIYGLIISKNKQIPLSDYIKSKLNKYSKIDISIGILIGFIAMLGIYLLEFNLNYIQVKSTNNFNVKFIVTFCSLAVMALGEELLFRGFMLSGLMHLLKNKYIAVLITAILFGLAHAANPNATIVSVVSNGLGGVMYAIAFIESNSIWLPFGLHFAWNFSQGPIFGFPVSGMDFGGIIEQNSAVNQNLIYGGAYGPEGGIIGISFRILVILMLLLYYIFSLKKREKL
jgi:membrane protease YdiL (CAAX protease family)